MKTFLQFLEDNAFGSFFKSKNLVNQEPVSKSQLDRLEKILDSLYASLGIDVEFTRHFLDRVNDKRNVVQISIPELEKIFRDVYREHGTKISKLDNKSQAILADLSTDINIPFVINLKNGELELVSKTVMRKSNFKSSNDKYIVK